MSRSEKSVAKIREEARKRLCELEPLLEEAERLRTVLAVLESEVQVPAGGDSAAYVQVPAGGDSGAYVPATKHRILEIIGENPGITAPEIARRSGMKRTVVASTMSRLKRTGELLAEGDGARLPDAPHDSVPHSGNGSAPALA